MISSLFDIFNSVCLECGCLCYIHSLPGTKIFPKLLLFPLFSDVIYGIVYWGFLCIIACTNYLSMKMKELCIYLRFSRRVDYCISIILLGVGVYINAKEQNGIISKPTKNHHLTSFSHLLQPQLQSISPRSPSPCSKQPTVHPQ